jgi:hypothetical protein
VSARAIFVVLLACASPGASHAQEPAPYAEGSLAWIDSDRLNLVGTVAAELPFVEVGPWRVFTSVRAVTAIESASSDFTFLVDQVSYGLSFGARRELAGHGAVEVFAGEQGFVLVDAPGGARVRLVGTAWESRNFHAVSPALGWSGRASLAAVIEHRDVDAFAVATGAVRFLGRATQGGRVAIGADATADALLGKDGGADYSIGPRVEFDLGADRRFGLFVRWLHGGNPLGLGTDGLLAGFDVAEGVHPGGARPTPPEIAGLCAAGAGDDGRGLARVELRAASPPFFRGTYFEIEVDGNVLTSGDANDLFYLYDVGVAQPFTSWRAGVWFHHRSNHIANALNATVNSINVLEAGVESAGWNRAEPGVALGRAGAIDAQVRAGWLIDSTFGQDASWHARGGLRWASPELGSARIYLSMALERGDVSGSDYALGTLLPRGWDLRVEVLHDEQLFSVDRRARLAVATLRY